MLVLTLDQRDSRRSNDAVPGLLEELAPLQPLRPFQRTAGDEVQAVFDDAGAALSAALTAAADGGWNVGIGAGDVRSPLPPETRAGAGAAFEAARAAVERAKKVQSRVAVDSLPERDEAKRVEAELAVLVLSLRRRTPEQHEACRLRAQGLKQRDIAQRLGVSPQAISARLAAALYDELEALRRGTLTGLRALLDMSDA